MATINDGMKMYCTKGAFGSNMGIEIGMGFSEVACLLGIFLFLLSY